MFKRLLSYFVPVKLATYESDFSGTLVVNLLNGKKILDTNISNYSYGSLQRIFFKALRKLPFDNSIKTVLVLGMGAGSIVETIRESFHSTAFITLVDIDEIIISIAEKEFGIYQFNNIKIIQADAAEFVNTNSDFFDLIIIDLFLIDTIPETCTHSSFIQAVCNRLNKNGKLVFNTIRDTLPKQVFQDIVQELNKQGISTHILKKLEGDNDMILGTKNIGQFADPDRISAFQ